MARVDQEVSDKFTSRLFLISLKLVNLAETCWYICPLHSSPEAMSMIRLSLDGVASSEAILFFPRGSTLRSPLTSRPKFEQWACAREKR